LNGLLNQHYRGLSSKTLLNHCILFLSTLEKPFAWLRGGFSGVWSIFVLEKAIQQGSTPSDALSKVKGN
jgi:hypothetical protein